MASLLSIVKQRFLKFGNSPSTIFRQNPDIFATQISNYSDSGKSKEAECKVAIVTGSARGIGYSIAEYLLKGGAKVVVLSDVLAKECEKAAIKLNQKYGDEKSFFQPCDVTKREEFEKLFKCTKDRFGQIDIVVNNAGILADSRWEDCININARGFVMGTLLGMKYMGAHKGAKGGVVINVASILGLEPLPGCPVYTATKHFVVGYTRSMGSKYFHDLTKVKVMAVGPSRTDTAMITDAEKMAMSGFGNLGKVLADGLNSLPDQSPDEVGKCVLAMLKDGTNGSMWVSEACECYMVKRMTRQELRIHPKKGDQGKKDEKKDCKEQKKEDLCKKQQKKEEKKEDPCKKQQKKEDPCKKDQKKEDPCKKDQKKEDPCKVEKKEDPCKKQQKKEDPCKKEQKKEDPCKVEKKEDPCKKPQKKEDPCKKEKKKEDPCKKDQKKEDPCKKEQKKEDPCKKPEKKDPCK